MNFVKKQFTIYHIFIMICSIKTFKLNNIHEYTHLQIEMFYSRILTCINSYNNFREDARPWNPAI